MAVYGIEEIDGKEVEECEIKEDNLVCELEDGSEEEIDLSNVKIDEEE